MVDDQWPRLDPADHTEDDPSLLEVAEHGRGLPDDPDPEELGVDRARPVHLRLSSILLVFTGGMAGTAIREALALRFSGGSSILYTIGSINIVGAFLLGLLLESLARGGPDTGSRRRVRLLLGTGVMGGFTTYSTFAFDAARLARDGHPGVAAGYGVITVIVGAAATVAGIAVAVAARRHRSGGA